MNVRNGILNIEKFLMVEDKKGGKRGKKVEEKPWKDGRKNIMQKRRRK